ncbi:dentin sialophosphoprotein-like [Helicoverpa zea]|uniref:dentin sialophosphoprotein-like n=1 Tax=Helicoverpa zea TaxID=7113 RepID=UPI001F5AE0A2|nr:dentin sialophosphoprotein-like [Helicoverpa zea]
MSSSDSDYDIYGNIAQKLQAIKNSLLKEKVESAVTSDRTDVGPSSSTLPTVTVDEELNSTVNSTDNNTKAKPRRGRGGRRKASSNSCGSSSRTDVGPSSSTLPTVTVDEELNSTVNSTDSDEYTLDAIIANNTKAKPRRGRGGNCRASSNSCGSSNRTTRTASQSTNNSNKDDTFDKEDAPTTSNRGQHAGKGRSPRAGRGRSTHAGRERSTRARSRGMSSRERGRTARNELIEIFDDFSSPDRCSPVTSNDCPIISIGNTDEYPDQCENQQLFSSNVRHSSDDVEIVDMDSLEDDNEEMSVKVYWRSLEIFKFNIRKYQKITQLFNYFSEKEGVSSNHLLFIYNDKILKMDDTPDSINYNIAKFIDGGIVNQDVRKLIAGNNENNESSGFKLKFQCQNKKKPFETFMNPHEKLMLAMIKCAEHLETPLERLRFYFDGDLISSKNTPQDLELEGGECIDVKISSL